jgi:hypothetical protein
MRAGDRTKGGGEIFSQFLEVDVHGFYCGLDAVFSAAVLVFKLRFFASSIYSWRFERYAGKATIQIPMQAAALKTVTSHVQFARNTGRLSSQNLIPRRPARPSKKPSARRASH